MRKVSWTTPEIERLTQLTEHSRKFDKKIYWDVVAAQIPSRTASQCKSYYANVLKKTLDVQIRQNHRWNRVEIIALWALLLTLTRIMRSFSRITFRTCQQNKSRASLFKFRINNKRCIRYSSRSSLIPCTYKSQAKRIFKCSGGFSRLLLAVRSQQTQKQIINKIMYQQVIFQLTFSRQSQ
ncbi:Conserved_hypothetical protein [Hexamita inflata]|uniref:Myb-like domain-containing protein n=1 Tax=Hexamita inflata TaxID=28002 RepID=A0AA86PY85_9EUKA|nr:Conserved hypothetical protein [Hexamita inflata]